MAIERYSVAVCRFPGVGIERHEVGSWLMRLGHQLKVDPRISRVMVSGVYSGTPITMLRNKAVRDALAEEIDYILMIDSDMEPDYLVGVDKLARPFWEVAWDLQMAVRESSNGEHRPCAVAAPYCGPPPEETVYAMKWHVLEGGVPNPPFRLEQIDREDSARRTGLEKVPAMATGLILYDARIFKEMAQLPGGLPWFEYEYEDEYKSAVVSTEDVYQSRNASMLGYPQYVAWDCWARHWKWKGVERPTIIPSDAVHETFASAVRRGFRSDQRLHFVARPAGALSANGPEEAI